MIYATAFREYHPGSESLLEEWTQRWNAPTAIVRHPLFDREPHLRYTGQTGIGGLTWDIIDSDADRDECRIRAVVIPVSGHKPAPVLIARQSGTAGAANAYRLSIGTNDNSLRITKISGGATSTLDSEVGLAGVRIARGEILYLDFRVQVTGGGSSALVSAKAWNYGDAEPVADQVSATDVSPLAIGGIGVGGDADTDCIYLFFSAATGGDIALTYEEFGPSINGLTDLRSEIEHTLEVTPADTTTGDETSEYYSTHGRSGSPTDLPTSSMDRLVESISADHTIAADFDFGGNDISSVASVLLRNKPRSESAVGPVDHWRSKTLEGRPGILRVGKVGKLHRSFSRLASGLVVPEPNYTEEMPVVQVESASGRALRELLQVGRYAGQQHCVRLLTNTISPGALVVPTDSAYDITSFVWLSRVSFPAGIPSNNISRRHTDNNNSQWLFQINHSAGVISLSCSVGGTPTTLVSAAVSDFRNDGLFHAIAFGILAGEFAYIMIDGMVVGSAEGIGTPDIENQSIIAIETSTAGLRHFDHRFYDKFIPPESMAAQSTTVVGPASHSALAGLWLLNDGSGTTAVDSSPTANDGSINATLDTNWEWAPTYEGDAGFAGSPKPVIYGLPRGVPCPRIDPGREIFAVNDGDFESDFRADPARSQGVARTFNTDYIDSGNGSIDFSDVQAQPVTADISSPGGNETDAYVGAVIQAIVENRSSGIELDEAAIDAINIILPYQCGWHSLGNIPSISEVLSDILGPIGAHFHEDVHGRLVPWIVLPALGLDPHGDPWIEYYGALDPESRPQFSELTGVASGSYTAMCEFKTIHPKMGFDDFDANAPNQYLFRAMDSDHDLLWELRLFGGSGRLWHSMLETLPVSTISGAGEVEYGKNYFAAVVFDDTNNTTTIYLGDHDGTGEVRQIAQSTGVTGSPSAPTAYQLGAQFVGGISKFRVFDFAISIDSLQLLMNGGGTLAFVPPDMLIPAEISIPASAGYGPLIEEEHEALTLVQDSRWCPVMSLDLTRGQTVFRWAQKPRTFIPSKSVDIRYDRNWSPLAYTDIATGVDAEDRSSFTEPSKSVQLEIESHYLAAKELILDTVLTRELDARSAARTVTDRRRPDQMFGVLAIPYQVGLGLRITDEIRIIDRLSGLESGWSARVVNKELSGNELLIHLLGKRP